MAKRRPEIEIIQLSALTKKSRGATVLPFHGMDSIYKVKSTSATCSVKFRTI